MQENIIFKGSSQKPCLQSRPQKQAVHIKRGATGHASAQRSNAPRTCVHRQSSPAASAAPAQPELDAAVLRKMVTGPFAQLSDRELFINNRGKNVLKSRYSVSGERSIEDSVTTNANAVRLFFLFVGKQLLIKWPCFYRRCTRASP